MSQTTSSGPSYFEGRRNQERIRKTLIFVLLVVGSASFLMPLWWMLQTSLKSLEEIVQYPPTWWPETFVWSNYVETWAAGNFTRYTWNTSIIAFFVVIGQVLSNSFIAYGFAKIKFPGRGLLFLVILGTMTIPGFVTMIPTYLLFSKIGWVGSYLPLIVPSFFGGAFQIFLFRQYFMTIPNDLVEAAKIDGANHVYVWARLMVPLSKPVMATIAIMAFNGAWNDFLGPLIYVASEDMYTLQIGLQAFKVSSGVNQWHYLMAGSVLVLLPVLILFFIFQRYFIEGMNISAGTKG
ncbi:MAG TPA: carbohydrate ABC transporter permease [Paenibacillus sp.]|nr:carbohydrate ABC transporter permease [Paenibacillus sp.]